MPRDPWTSEKFEPLDDGTKRMDAEGIEPSAGGRCNPSPRRGQYAILIDHGVSVVREAAC